MQFNAVVLYVDDDPGSREVMDLLLSTILELPHVTILSDSTNFLGTLTSLTPKPDIVLLDIHVEPLDGFEMLNAVRTLPQFSTTPVVALTASVMNEEVQRLREAGFHGVIAKPIDIDIFPSLLSRILNGENYWNVYLS
jgi:two-component system sensor histidine kinase/response regulator